VIPGVKCQVGGCRVSRAGNLKGRLATPERIKNTAGSAAVVLRIDLVFGIRCGLSNPAFDSESQCADTSCG
jgi:hypothetical protein